jgi:hypothetical protein
VHFHVFVFHLLSRFWFNFFELGHRPGSNHVTVAVFSYLSQQLRLTDVLPIDVFVYWLEIAGGVNSDQLLLGIELENTFGRVAHLVVEKPVRVTRPRQCFEVERIMPDVLVPFHALRVL